MFAESGNSCSSMKICPLVGLSRPTIFLSSCTLLPVPEVPKITKFDLGHVKRDAFKHFALAETLAHLAEGIIVCPPSAARRDVRE